MSAPRLPWMRISAPAWTIGSAAETPPHEWSFDATGFVRPGPLALYRPSMGLTDYQHAVPGDDRSRKR